MSKYIFTLAKTDDVPEVWHLYKSLVGTPGCTWSDDYPAIENVESDIAAQSLYILKNGDKLISAAFAGYCDELAEFEWQCKNPCELARIGVEPSMQGQGIGSLMLKNVIDAAQTRGFDGIRMLVSRSNPAALAMYDKNGFTRLDEVRMFDIDFYRYEMRF